MYYTNIKVDLDLAIRQKQFGFNDRRMVKGN